ncbi:MAG: alpha/beta hydrolase [Thermoanaerobaculia bacterium]
MAGSGPRSSMTVARQALLPALAALLLGGCGALRPATVPIRTVAIESGGSGRCLAVLLPGRFAAPEGFAKGKFGEAVRERGLDLDVIAVDAHLGYYRTRTVLERVREDVILPARAKGYDQVWLVGTSLGGLGSLLALRDHPEDLSGVLAIASFLGDDDVLREIEAAGGPRLWKPPAEIAQNDIGRNIWGWLSTGEVADAKVPVHVGWGTSDDFDRSNRMLASLLPPDRTYTASGAHDMETWNRVWTQFLDRVGPCRKNR